MKLRTFKAENLYEDVGQGSSSVVHPSRRGWQKKVSYCWAAFIPGIYTGPGMVPWVAVSPPNVKGSPLVLHPKAQIRICIGIARRTTGFP